MGEHASCFVFWPLINGLTYVVTADISQKMKKEMTFHWNGNVNTGIHTVYKTCEIEKPIASGYCILGVVF